MRFQIEVNNFNLDLTFKPSFISSLYQKIEPNHWVKITGYLGGLLELRQIKPNILEVKSNAKLTEKDLRIKVMLETGLWQGPYEDMVNKLPSSIKPQIKALSEAYSGVRLPIAPLDFTHLLIAITLSKRADYERFVLNWCKRIWSKYNGDIYKLSKASINELKEISSSYQIFQLQKTLKSFIELINHLPEKIVKVFGNPKSPFEEYILMLPPKVARILLINGCWGLGPKTVDSLILSTFKATDFIPCDTHLQSVSMRLGFFSGESKMPNSNFCSKFICDEFNIYDIQPCPLFKNDLCLKAKLSYLGLLGGWVQTLIYLHGRAYCKKLNPKCDICPINNICPKFGL